MFYSYNYCSISKSIFIQAFSPPPRGAPCFPNASHWAELMRPFKAFTERSAFSIQPTNNSTPQRPEGVSSLEAHGTKLIVNG